MNFEKKFSIVVATNNDSLIGIREYGEYTLPWPMIKEDMDFFRRITCQTHEPSQINAIIIGYNTWLTLPNIYKKNIKRKNIIISRSFSTDKITGTEKYVESLDDALSYASTISNLDNIYVIGGAAIYDIALGHPLLDTIYLTYIKHSYPADNEIEQQIYFPLTHTHLNDFVANNSLVLASVSDKYNDIGKNICFNFKKYVCTEKFREIYAATKKNQRIIYSKQCTTLINSDKDDIGEFQYLTLIKTIMSKGIFKQTRNAITKSIFGYQLRYDLAEGYPISTVKKSYPKTIFEELMWMIRGQTNVKKLQEKNVHIWDKNSTKEYLEKYNLPYEEGDIGPGYGFQMRYFGAKYLDCHADYHGQGVDQLNECINLINNDPHSRRIIIDLWNCVDVPKMSLPACHINYNFGVDLYDKPLASGTKGKLNCHLLQRSWDVLLGWNTTTAALLTYLLAHHCNLNPGILVHSITDAHLYKEHIDSGAINKLLNRRPRKFPSIKFIKKHDSIEKYEFNDLVIENYYPCPPIIAGMIA